MMANQALRVLVGEHIETRERIWREQLAERRKIRSKERKKKTMKKDMLNKRDSGIDEIVKKENEMFRLL